MRELLERLRARGAARCVVLGSPDYYGRFGFIADPDLILPGVPAQYFQALRSRGTQPCGTVTYHEAFRAEEPYEPPRSSASHR